MAIINDKSAFFEATKLRTETVDISDESSVVVTELPADDFVELWTNEEFSNGENGIDIQKMTPFLIARCVVGENGEKIFSDNDAIRLKKINSTAFFKIAKSARELNGLGAVKNSEASQEENSSSGSQEN